MASARGVLAGIARAPNLCAALLAGTAWLALAATLDVASHALAARALHRFPPRAIDERSRGVLVARMEIAKPDHLLVFGSSELVRPSENRAGEFFASAPTGFSVVPIGERGTPPLVTLERLASLGNRLRGRKVVLILTPQTFRAAPGPQDYDGYLAHRSRLQTGEALFGRAVDPEVRRALARRLLEIPQVSADDTFLATALPALAASGPLARAESTLLCTLGRMQNAELALADDARVLWLLRRSTPRVDAAPPQRTPPAWAALRAQAEGDYARTVAGHAFGFRAREWADAAYVAGAVATGGPGRFEAQLRASPRWGDLDLVLTLLERSGADALVISLPFAGVYADALQIGPPARAVYYRRFAGLARAHHVRCLTLESLEYEPYVFQDPYGHPSPKGWILLDELLDAFFHDRLARA